MTRKAIELHQKHEITDDILTQSSQPFSLDELGLKKPKHKEKKLTHVNDGFDLIDVDNPPSKEGNPMSVGDTVKIISKDPRYKLAKGFKNTLEGRVCAIDTSDSVSVSFWDTCPAVIKRVPLKHLKIVSKASVPEEVVVTKVETPSAPEVKYEANKEDLVNAKRYNQGNIEVWDFILDQNLGFLEGNVVKYLSRYKSKGGVKDVEKALTYLLKLYSIESGTEFNNLLEKKLGDILG